MYLIQLRIYSRSKVKGDECNANMKLLCKMGNCPLFYTET
jgi:hypothetical protein